MPGPLNQPCVSHLYKALQRIQRKRDKVEELSELKQKVHGCVKKLPLIWKVHMHSVVLYVCDPVVVVHPLQIAQLSIKFTKKSIEQAE
jgi:hypothetical protein